MTSTSGRTGTFATSQVHQVMNAEPQARSDAMDALRERYIADLTEQESQFRQAMTSLRESELETDARDALRARAHKLAGNGATYGFDDISRTAAALEAILEPGTSVSRDALLFHLGDLIDAMVAAHTTAPSDPSLPAPTHLDEIDDNRRDGDQEAARPKVLIVDHDPEARDTLISILIGKVDAITASSAEDALHIMQKTRPDLLLLGDLAKTDISVLELQEQIRGIEALRAVRTILITSKYDPESVMRARTAGALDYIVKPFNKAKVRERLMTRLRRLSKTVFIVDDDRAICDLLARKFAAVGYRTTTFEDGLSALSEIIETRPDLIILDKVMPGLDGMMVLEKLRNLDILRDTAVVMLSARRQESDIFKGFEMGAADYIVKPFNPQDLANRCIKLLATRDQSRENQTARS